MRTTGNRLIPMIRLLNRAIYSTCHGGPCSRVSFLLALPTHYAIILIPSFSTNDMFRAGARSFFAFDWHLSAEGDVPWRKNGH